MLIVDSVVASKRHCDSLDNLQRPTVLNRRTLVGWRIQKFFVLYATEPRYRGEQKS